MKIPREAMIGNRMNYTEEMSKQDNAFLSQDDFLKILAAELSNPSFDVGEGGGSGSHTDYMGQLIQFNMLDQMNELTSSIQSTVLMSHQQQALSLVGKNVKLETSEGEIVRGLVEKVTFEQGYASIQVNGKNYSMNDVIEVGDSSDDK